MAEGIFAGWIEWDDDLKHRVPEALAKMEKNLADEIRQECFEQYIFELQWQELRAYANKHGIQILGDMPIFVSQNSADVWSNQKLFKLDQNCRPYKVVYHLIISVQQVSCGATLNMTGMKWKNRTIAGGLIV